MPNKVNLDRYDDRDLVRTNLIEGDVFRIVVKAPEFSKTGEKSGAPEVTPHVAPQVKRLLEVVKGEVDRDALHKAVGLKARKTPNCLCGMIRWLR